MEIKKLKDTVHGMGNFCLYGPSGAGKTMSLETLPPKTIILAAEKGLRTLVDTRPDLDVLEINSMNDMREAHMLISGVHPTDPSKNTDGADYDYIAVDSLSELADFALNEAKLESKDGRQHYMMMADKISGCILAFNNMKQTIIWICQEERVNQEDLGVLDYVYAPSIPGRKFATKVPYKLDFVWCLRTKVVEDDKVERAFQTGPHGDYLAKSRSQRLDTFEDADWSRIFDKLAGKGK